MAHRNVRTRLAVLHHHGDDLVEMEETYRERDEVPLDETAIVIYLCPRCETIVTVGTITTEVGTPLPPALGADSIRAADAQGDGDAGHGSELVRRRDGYLRADAQRHPQGPTPTSCHADVAARTKPNRPVHRYS